MLDVVLCCESKRQSGDACSLTALDYSTQTIYSFIHSYKDIDSICILHTSITSIKQTSKQGKETALVAASGGKTKEHLEGIVTIRPNVSSCSRPDREGQGHLHEPLETCQCSQHGNSDWKTVPQACKSNVLVDSGYSMPGRFTS